MADVTDPFRAAARLAKTAAIRTEVVSAWWGTVASVSGVDITVILDGDDLLQVQPVTVNATGPCMVGDDVLLQMQGRDLTIISNPSAMARLAITGWVDVTPSTGFTGTLRVRRVGPLAEVDCNLTGTIPVGATVLTAAIPALYQPVGSTSRIEALANGYPVSGYVGAGTLGVSQRTGASRTGVAMRGVWVAI